MSRLKKIIKKSMWWPVSQLFSHREGAQSWLEQTQVNGGLQELELTEATAPTDRNITP